MSLLRVGRFYWLDMRIHGKRVRRSLRTSEYALAIERTGDIKNQLLKEFERKDVKLRDFVKQYLDFLTSDSMRNILALERLYLYEGEV